MIKNNNKIYINQNIKRKRGFTLLISIVLTSVLLIISFVVANVALKQLVINYAGGGSLHAFYSADSGVECAMYWDVKNGSVSAFSTTTGGTIICHEQTISTGSQVVPTVPAQLSRIGGGGVANPTSIFTINFPDGCAIVSVTKQSNGDTLIDSKGYNTCDSSSSKRYERGITITY